LNISSIDNSRPEKGRVYIIDIIDTIDIIDIIDTFYSCREFLLKIIIFIAYFGHEERTIPSDIRKNRVGLIFLMSTSKHECNYDDSPID